MARQRTIRDEDILAAARALFLEQGYGVTTAAIARAAGVSEGTLFKRFPTKAALFRRAMGLPPVTLDRRAARLVGTASVRDNLVALTLEAIDFMRRSLPQVLVVCTSPVGDPLAFLREAHDGDAPPVQLVAALRSYLAAERSRGRIDAAADPDVLARVLVASAHHYVFFEILGLNDRSSLDAKRYVEHVVSALWRGIEPSAAPEEEARER